MGKNSFKKQRLEERILFELNKVLRTETSDSRLSNVSVTKVSVNRDLSQALIYWDTFDRESKPQVQKALEGMLPRLRTILAANLDMRKVPFLVLEYDMQFEAEEKITNLLKTQKAKN
jgi:ribosome-binding factor A